MVVNDFVRPIIIIFTTMFLACIECMVYRELKWLFINVYFNTTKFWNGQSPQTELTCSGVRIGTHFMVLGLGATTLAIPIADFSREVNQKMFLPIFCNMQFDQ